MKERVIFLAGPTASGKSKIAVALAKKINAEIISCDSMQVYRGMDILASQPAPAFRKRVAHHLLRFLSAEKEFNVSLYRSRALKKIEAVLRRKKTPLFVGGSGLYISAVVDGIFALRTENKALRRKLSREAQKKGSAFLHARLKIVDPLAAAKVHPNDAKRIIRALEVYRACGRPISQLQKERRGIGDKYEVRIFCLDLPREELYRRIGRRVELMFRQGLLKEVKKILKLKLSRTAGYAIGIRELEGYLAGEYGLESAKEIIKRNTRRYAKRQLAWFRKDKRIKWLETGAEERPGQTAERIWRELS